MSLSVVKLETVSVYDPRISNIVDNKLPKVPVLVSGATNQYYEYPSTSYSASSSTFQTNPPDIKAVVSKNITMKHFFEISFTGTTTSGNLLKSGFDGLASFPIAKALQTVTLTINNQVISLNYSDIYPALFRYEKTMSGNREDQSGTAYMLDEFNDLADWQTYGSARNSLAEYGENSYKISRGLLSSPFITILSNTPTSAVVRCEVVENLFLPILNWNVENLTTGLCNVNTLTWNMTYNNNLTNIWSHSDAGGSTFSNVTVTMNTSSPLLYLNFITASQLNVIPPTLVYDYYNIDRFVTSYGVLNAGQSATIISNNIQLGSVPKCIYIYVSQNKNTLDYTSTDTYAEITKFQMKFGNRDSILASANEYQLWTIAKKNGLNYSYQQWQKFIGSMFCIYFDEDISMVGDLLAAGVSGNFQMQIQVNVKNITNKNINYDLNIICIHEGTMTLSEKTCVINTSIISKDDVYKAVTSSENVSDDYQLYRQMTGRGLFDSIQKANRWINKKLIPATHGVARTLEKGTAAAQDVLGAISPAREMFRGQGVLSRQDLRDNIKKLM